METIHIYIIYNIYKIHPSTKASHIYSSMVFYYKTNNMIKHCLHLLHNFLFKKFIIIIIIFAAPRGMWDPSSPTRDGTRAPCSGSVES